LSTIKRAGRVAVVLCFSLAVGPAGISAAAPDPAAFLETAEVRPGMRGVAYSVLEGTRPTGFAVELLGVLGGIRPKGDFILFRALSDTLARTGIVAGMSGSPVYVEGKLVGAIAISFPFSKEPIGMITPIAEMLEGLSRIEEPPAPWMGVSRDVYDSFLGTFLSRSGDPSPWERIVPSRAESGGGRSLISLCASGWDPDMGPAFEAFSRRTGLPVPVAAAGGSVQGPAPEMRPGSALGVLLIDGDASLSAIGTLTHRRGDQIIAFGHPIFQAGPVALPMTAARIQAIVPSYNAPFKVGSAGPIIGTIRQDLRAGVSGKLGEVPPMLPVRIVLSGPSGTDHYSYRVARGVLLEPTLVAWAATNSFLQHGWRIGEATLDARLIVHYNKTCTLARRDRLASRVPATEISEQLLAPLPLLLANPFQRVVLDSLSLEVAYSTRLRESVLIDFWAEREKVRPGEILSLTARLQDHLGEVRQISVEIPVPERWRGRTLMILAGGGRDLTDWDKERAPALYEPKDLASLERLIRDFPDEGELLVRVYGEEDAVVLGDRELGPLPGSVAQVLGAAHKRGPARTAPNFRLEERRIDAGGAVRGVLGVRVRVE